MERLRVFIAIELPDAVRAQVARLQEKLKEADADVKWVEPQLVHLTLKFLGEVDQDKLETLYGGVSEAIGEQSRFPMSLAGIGAFPSMRRVQVVWIGVFSGAEEATGLAERIEASLEKRGFESEKKKFAPHITIGRVRSFRNATRLVKLIEEIPFSSDEFSGAAVTVVKSELTPQGPVYSPLWEKTLP
jgi:2'-5' RNA ligase